MVFLALSIKQQVLILKTKTWCKYFFFMFFGVAGLLSLLYFELSRFSQFRFSIFFLLIIMFCFSISFFFAIVNIICSILLRKNIKYIISIVFWGFIALISLVLFLIFLAQVVLSKEVLYGLMLSKEVFHVIHS